MKGYKCAHFLLTLARLLSFENAKDTLYKGMRIVIYFKLIIYMSRCKTLHVIEIVVRNCGDLE